MAFTFVFRLFLGPLHDRLRRLDIGIVLRSREPLFAIYGQSIDVESLDITWVDDCVIMAMFGDPLDITPPAKVIAGVAFTELRKLGFTPNTKIGKLR